MSAPTESGGPRKRRRSVAPRRMQSYCVRYSLTVMEKQAKLTRQSLDAPAAESLDQHISAIIADVRTQLSQPIVPSHYLKTEDPCVDTLQNLNQQRKAEIASHQKAVDQLEEKVLESEKELQKHKEERDSIRQLVEEEESKNKAKESLVRLLRGDDDQDSKEEEKPPKISEVAYQRAPKGTMAKFLKALFRKEGTT